MRVVVVGSGMAGARFAAELRARAPREHIVVFGSESTRSYNRILLSELLAGKVAESDLALAEPAGVIDQRAGVSVVSIDPAARTVETDDGSRTRYDALVLATGSRPLVPPVAGLTRPGGSLLAGAATFRTLADCRRILAAASRARSALVLGGGLLGVEAARGLAARGLRVQVLHARRHLMERQLDPDASHVLARTLAKLGVSVRLDTVTTAVLGTDRVEGVQLEDGTTVAAQLLVIACGVRPETGLAQRAGLDVGRGIVVDDAMRTSDDGIYAIGDCAEHQGRVYGLVAPAWDQARVAAEAISGGLTRYAGSRVVTRLKAAGVDLASMGNPHADDEDAEVVVFADPARATYQKVVIRDRRLVGAILVGDSPTVGMLTQLFDRGSPVPADPRSLLFGSGGRAPRSAETLPATATVCRCNGVSAGEIVRALLDGARTATDVAAATRASTGCGGCRELIDGFLTALTSHAVGATEGAAV